MRGMPSSMLCPKGFALVPTLLCSNCWLWDSRAEGPAKSRACFSGSNLLPAPKLDSELSLLEVRGTLEDPWWDSCSHFGKPGDLKLQALSWDWAVGGVRPRGLSVFGLHPLHPSAADLRRKEKKSPQGGTS